MNWLPGHALRYSQGHVDLSYAVKMLQAPSPFSQNIKCFKSPKFALRASPPQLTLVGGAEDQGTNRRVALRLVLLIVAPFNFSIFSLSHSPSWLNPSGGKTFGGLGPS